MPVIADDSIILRIETETKKLRSDLKKSKKDIKDFGDVGKKAGKELEESFEKVSEEIEQNNRVLGSWKDSLIGAARNTNVFGVNIGAAIDKLNAKRTALRGVITGLGGTSKALNIFKVALISTGIGAIVVALGSLVALLTRTQKGIDLVSRVSTALGTTFDVLTDRAILFGGAMVKVFSGDFKGAIEDVRATFTGLGEEIVNETKAAFDLEQRSQNLRDSQRDLNVEYAKSISSIERLREAARDESLTYAEREQAVRDAIKLENELEAKRIKNAQENLSIITEQNALNTSLVEDLERQAQAEIDVSNIQAETARKRRRDNQLLQALEREERAKRLKAFREEQKKEEEALKKIEEARRNIEKLKTSLLQNEFEKRKRTLLAEQTAAIEALFGTPEQVAEQAALIRQSFKIELDKIEEEINRRKINIELGTPEGLKPLPLPVEIDTGEVDTTNATEALAEIKEAGEDAAENSLKKLREEAAKLEEELKKLDAFEKLLEKIFGEGVAEDVKAAFSAVSQLTKSLVLDRKRAEIEITEQQIEEQQKRVDAALEIADEGNAEALQIEEEKLAALNEQRDKQVEEERKRAAQIAAIEQGLILIKSVAVALDVIKTAGNPFAAIAALAAVAGALINFKNTISDISPLPEFHEGTESVGDNRRLVYRNGNDPLKPDEQKAILRKKERVLTVEQNRPLLQMGIKNEDIPDLVAYALKVRAERERPVFKPLELMESIGFGRSMVNYNFQNTPTVHRLNKDGINIPDNTKELAAIGNQLGEVTNQLGTLNKKVSNMQTNVRIDKEGIAIISARYQRRINRKRK